MTITASIVADSISAEGARLTTMLLRYPRFIHAELMTHRVFSRNASSSRAIPVEKLIADMRRDPAMPVFWGSNKPGMQAGAELTDFSLAAVKDEWMVGMEHAINVAEEMMRHGLHKQIANRVLEPWAHINVVVTSTTWGNFWELRCHPDAQPEMRTLAEAMRTAFDASTPRPLNPGAWHLPFVTEADYDKANTAPDETSHTDPAGIDMLLRASVARCARTSYLTHDMKEPDIEADIRLHDMLVAARPIHASPAEHQATPDSTIGQGFPQDDGIRVRVWEKPRLHGNFEGWIQYRKILELTL